MKTNRLLDRVAIVTGASRGIGHALAIGLAREGAAVVVNYVACATGAEAAVAAIRGAGGRAVAVQADVGDLSQHARVVAAAEENFGRIDILVNNAARARRESFLDSTPEAWDETMNVNLKGLFFLSQAVARTMIPRRSGKIINISSVHDERPLRNKSIYTVSKGGLKLLTKSLAFELAEHGIQVNSVSPGAILTDETREVLADPAYLEKVLAKIPARRIGTVADVIGAVVLLASPESDYMNGATVYVDGGMLL